MAGSLGPVATGQTLGKPIRGSLIIPEMNDDAAVEGAPDRIAMVGSRRILPSMKFFRV